MILSSLGAAGATTLLLVMVAVPAGAKTPPKDRGEASMKVGGQPWSAKRASARVREDRLSITATWSERIKDVRRSETVRLVLKGYAGPGEYEANASSSFSKVGVDAKAIAAAEGNDEATTKAVTDLLRKSEIILLRGAKVIITSADAKEIRGTFTSGRATLGPPITGRFRALVKKKRARSKRRSRPAPTKSSSSD